MIRGVRRALPHSCAHRKPEGGEHLAPCCAGSSGTAAFLTRPRRSVRVLCGTRLSGRGDARADDRPRKTRSMAVIEEGETDRSEWRYVPGDRYRRDEEQQHDRDRARGVGPTE
jgi:hypothetical protein